MITLRKTSYKGMFYRIFIVGGVIDIIAILNNYIGAIFPSRRSRCFYIIAKFDYFCFSWFLDFYMSRGTTVGHVYLIIAWTTRCSQGCTVTLLALNRATAVCSPIRHKQ
ncbi:hypothetical protein GCK32_000003, partial [Trichostrongylus colubriformis]